MTMQRLAMCVIAAAMATTAQAATFTSANDGHWSTQRQSVRFDTWGLGIATPPVAGTDYPWGTDDSTANDDIATIQHQVTINAYTPWSGVGSPLPQELTIVMDGGELRWFHIGGVSANPVVRSTIEVNQDSTLSNASSAAWTSIGGRGNPAIINGTVSDGTSSTGNLILAPNTVLEIGEFGQGSFGDRSGFSGDWIIGSSTIVVGWNSNPGTGSQVFGTGDLDIDGGLVQFSRDVGNLPNGVNVGAGGATIRADGTFGAIDATLDGLVSGDGTLSLNVVESAGRITLTNTGNSVAAVAKDGPGLAEFTAPGALPGDLLTINSGTVELNSVAGVWDVSDMELILAGGALEYDAIVTELIVEALTVDGTSFGPGSYDITQSFSGVDFSAFFNGTGNVTVATIQDQIVPEPVSIAIWSLLGLGFCGFAYFRCRKN